MEDCVASDGPLSRRSSGGVSPPHSLPPLPPPPPDPQRSIESKQKSTPDPQLASNQVPESVGFPLDMRKFQNIKPQAASVVVSSPLMCRVAQSSPVAVPKYHASEIGEKCSKTSASTQTLSRGSSLGDIFEEDCLPGPSPTVKKVRSKSVTFDDHVEKSEIEYSAESEEEPCKVKATITAVPYPSIVQHIDIPQKCDVIRPPVKDPPVNCSPRDLPVERDNPFRENLNNEPTNPHNPSHPFPLNTVQEQLLGNSMRYPNYPMNFYPYPREPQFPQSAPKSSSVNNIVPNEMNVTTMNINFGPNVDYPYHPDRSVPVPVGPQNFHYPPFFFPPHLQLGPYDPRNAYFFNQGNQLYLNNTNVDSDRSSSMSDSPSLGAYQPRFTQERRTEETHFEYFPQIKNSFEKPNVQQVPELNVCGDSTLSPKEQKKVVSTTSEIRKVPMNDSSFIHNQNIRTASPVSIEKAVSSPSLDSTSIYKNPRHSTSEKSKTTEEFIPITSKTVCDSKSSSSFQLDLQSPTPFEIPKTVKFNTEPRKLKSILRNSFLENSGTGDPGGITGRMVASTSMPSLNLSPKTPLFDKSLLGTVFRYPSNSHLSQSTEDILSTSSKVSPISPPKYYTLPSKKSPKIFSSILPKPFISRSTLELRISDPPKFEFMTGEDFTKEASKAKEKFSYSPSEENKSLGPKYRSPLETFELGSDPFDSLKKSHKVKDVSASHGGSFIGSQSPCSTVFDTNTYSSASPSLFQSISRDNPIKEKDTEENSHTSLYVSSDLDSKSKTVYTYPSEGACTAVMSDFIDIKPKSINLDKTVEPKYTTGNFDTAENICIRESLKKSDQDTISQVISSSDLQSKTNFTYPTAGVLSEDLCNYLGVISKSSNSSKTIPKISPNSVEMYSTANNSSVEMSQKSKGDDSIYWKSEKVCYPSVIGLPQDLSNYLSAVYKSDNSVGRSQPSDSIQLKTENIFQSYPGIPEPVEPPLDFPRAPSPPLPPTPPPSTSTSYVSLLSPDADLLTCLNCKKGVCHLLHSAPALSESEAISEFVCRPDPPPPPVNYNTLPKDLTSPTWQEFILKAPPATACSSSHKACNNPVEPKSPDVKASVSDKKKFFEKAMEEHHQPSPKPERVFTFLSQDEVEKMKQEEERKIASLTSAQISQDLSGDEIEEHNVEDKSSELRRLVSEKGVDGILKMPSIRTLKAERRMKEKLIKEGLLSDDDESELSPAEQRALKAEKRAAWRQARLKSLEQDALEAQMVIKKMSEIIDSKPAAEDGMGDINDATIINNNRAIMDHENNLTQVETTKEKIISLELSSPDKDEKDDVEEEGVEPAATAENGGTNPRSRRRKKKSRKNSKS